MGAFLVQVLGLALVAVWLRLRPRPRLGTLFLLWWAGLLLFRQSPGLLSAVAGERLNHSPAFGSLVAGLAWAGAFLNLRALLGFVLWQRPITRRVRLGLALLGAALLLGGAAPAGLPFTALIGLPVLFSYRWVSGMGAGRMALVTASGLLSVALSLLSVTTRLDVAPGVGGRLGVMPAQMMLLTPLYALLSLPATAGRIHLSIRRIWVRLVGSHLLAGLVPLGLVVLFLLFSGSFFLANYRGSLGARLLTEASAAASRELSRSLVVTGKIPAEPFGAQFGGQIVLARLGGSPTEVVGERPGFSPDTLLLQEIRSAEAPLLWDRQRLFLRARFDTLYNGAILRLEALAPLDSLHLVRISRLVGVPVRVSPHIAFQEAGGGGVVISREDEWGHRGADSTRTPAVGPESRLAWQLPGGTTISCLRPAAGCWVPSPILVSSWAGFGEEFGAILHGGRESATGLMVLVALGVTALLFLGAIWVTAKKVWEMGQSITHTVRALTDGAGSLRKGHLDYRIPIRGDDELWGVAQSFNQMAEGLERMRAMELERQRLDEELRLAREIQQRLLPAGPPHMSGLELAGLSLPAREVGGDYYDYLPLDGGRVGLAIADVSGKGTPAALLMSAFRASLRSQDLGRLGPAEVLTRVNRFIHSSVDPGRFVTAFLAVLDPHSGELRYSSAGHDAPYLVRPDGAVTVLSDGGLLLGLMPQVAYPEKVLTLEPGTLFTAFTDGVTEAQDAKGEFFGAGRLESALRAAPVAPAPRCSTAWCGRSRRSPRPGFRRTTSR
jgi:HAMP domain-containing protein